NWAAHTLAASITFRWRERPTQGQIVAQGGGGSRSFFMPCRSAPRSGIPPIAFVKRSGDWRHRPPMLRGLLPKASVMALLVNPVDRALAQLQSREVLSAQPEDREGARHHRPAALVRPCRRSDRVNGAVLPSERETISTEWRMADE